MWAWLGAWACLKLQSTPCLRRSQLNPTLYQHNTERTAGKFPFGAVPVLEVNGVTYAQSVGLLRYCGRLGGASWSVCVCVGLPLPPPLS